MPADEIALPDAPDIAGLAFRHIRGGEDADALLAVRVRSMAHDAIDPLSTLEGVPGSEQMLIQLAESAASGEHDR